PRHHRPLHSFPTRRSSDLIEETSALLESLGYSTQVHARDINFFYLTDEYRERIVRLDDGRFEVLHQQRLFSEQELQAEIDTHPEDRKSTRLNSSHVKISYA